MKKPKVIKLSYDDEELKIEVAHRTDFDEPSNTPEQETGRAIAELLFHLNAKHAFEALVAAVMKLASMGARNVLGTDEEEKKLTDELLSLATELEYFYSDKAEKRAASWSAAATAMARNEAKKALQKRP